VLGTFLKPLAVEHYHRLKAVGLALDGVAVERVHLVVDRSVIWFHSLYALVDVSLCEFMWKWYGLGGIACAAFELLCETFVLISVDRSNP